MIIENFEDFKNVEPVIYRHVSFGYDVYIVLGGLSLSGSLKFNTALNIIDNLEKEYNNRLEKLTLLVSSSGNLAVSLAQICRERGYRLAAVIDPFISQINRNILKIYDVELHTVKDKDVNDGYLLTRFEKIKKLLNTGNYLYMINTV